MHATLRLDDDVAQAVERLRQERNAPLEEIINEVLRAGLSRLTTQGAQQRFRTEPVSLGQCRPANLDNVAEVLAWAEEDERP